jgi:hypothetical protein
MEPAPRPRVLVLAREQVLHWAALYIAAFRECCDTLVCGPPLDMVGRAEHGWAHTAQWLEPNDIVSEADTLEAIEALLPEGWRPDLIVSIQSVGPDIRDIARAACPTVYLSIDTWHDPQEFRHARPYDFVFAAQRELVPHFVEAGVRHAHWLPLACSPRHHHPVNIEPEFDLVFAGITFYTVNRQRMGRLLRLHDRFDLCTGGGLGGEDYCRALSQGRVVFNSSVAQDVNMRVFEAMAIGRPLLTNRDAEANGLADLFEEGVHYLGYDDDDLLAQAECLLVNSALRDALAANARREVLARHTYRHRVETLLQTVSAVAPLAAAPLRAQPRLSDWLPTGARRVLDVGCGMDRSRIALRRQGVEWLGAIPLDVGTTRAGSYDALLSWDEAADCEVDTITCAVPMDPDELFAKAAQVLPPGGELVLLTSGPQPAEAQGFHMILSHALSDGANVLRFRRYTRSLDDITYAIHTRFPGGAYHELPNLEEPQP